MRGLRGLFILAIFGAAFAQNPELPRCREGVAQPSARVLVTKLSRAFEQQDTAVMANLASCPFSVATPESDDLSYVPPAVFARRFLGEVEVLDLTLEKGDVSSTYTQEPRRIFLWLGRGEKRATLFVDSRPRADFQHHHIFSFGRDADGWRFKSYSTHDGGLLERLRRGYTAVLVQAAK